MPTKVKKSNPSKLTTSKPTKKFVVEETPEAKKEETTEDLPVKQELPPSGDVETKVESVSLEKEVEKPETVTQNTEEKPVDETVLNSPEEKDTLPASSITSFSLLDSDKPETKEVTPMQDTTTESATTTSQQASDIPVKSSQDEVNKWIENYDDKETGETKKKGSGFFKTFLIILIVLSLGAVIAGGVYYYQKNIAGGGETDTVKEESVVQNEEPTPVPTKEPEKEVEAVDYSKYTLQILNGSGVPGEAGKAKDLVSDLEFKSVVTGNASNYKFEKTVISVKDTLSDQVFTDIKKALESTYEVESKAETLKETSTYDVVITVGPKK